MLYLYSWQASGAGCQHSLSEWERLDVILLPVLSEQSLSLLVSCWFWFFFLVLLSVGLLEYFLVTRFYNS